MFKRSYISPQNQINKAAVIVVDKTDCSKTACADKDATNTMIVIPITDESEKYSQKSVAGNVDKFHLA